MLSDARIENVAPLSLAMGLTAAIGAEANVFSLKVLFPLSRVGSIRDYGPRAST